MLDTLIIGSGFSGIGLGARLVPTGRRFEIWESAPELGGTWRDNHYPGSACDISSPVYYFSFAPKPDWSRLYPAQPEILDYLRQVALDHKLERHFRFNRRMRRASWQRDHWRVEAADGTVAKARFLLLGTGALSKYRIPDLAGLGDFRGAVWHSAEWRHEHPIDGRNIAVIGTGASAIQFVPEIAARAKRLAVFQRSAPWVVPKEGRAISPARAENWRRQPWRQKLLRLFLFSRSELLVRPLTRMRGLDRFEKMARDHLEKAITDPDLRARLRPQYRFGCKRLLISNDWYPTLARANVELVTAPILAVTASGIRTGDGIEHPCDAIIFGTGFDIEAGYRDVEIIGAGGVRLSKMWADIPKAHLGISVSGFPNLFMTMGPATGLGHNSIIYMIEAQIAHILSAMRLSDRLGGPIMPRPEAQQAFFDKVQGRMERSVWTRGGCDSWYLGGKGRNYTLWPGYSFAYRWLVRRARRADYQTVAGS